MNTWFRVPFSNKIVVKNDDHQRVCVIVNSRPTVKCGMCEFYPRAWQGRRGQHGETITWDFPMGPVRTLLTHKDRKNRKWVHIVWR